jgi:GNAT superfamily N-acetyltransferase
MTGIYKIRPVDGGDEWFADMLRDLHTETFLDTAETPDFSHGFWWIVYSDSALAQPVGFAGITPSTYRPNTGYLKRAAVIRAHRGHGLQRRMISVRERFARRMGWDAIYTDTATFNVKSSNNLFKAGFELFRPDPIWNGEDFLYWRKHIG